MPDSNPTPPNGGPSEQWASRIGVILAVAGSAVGLGNFLRFPGQAAQNGAGAFMIPYFISLLVIGIPMCWAEWTMGRYGGLNGFNSAPGIYSTLWKHRLAKYLGIVALLIPLVIYMYYVLIEAWCLTYALSYMMGHESLLGADADYEGFFGQVTGSSQDGALIAPRAWPLLAILVATFAINFVLIYRGVSKGIESFCKIAMPIMVVLALIVLARVLTLSPQEGRSVSDGLGFMWNPDFEALKNPKTWLAASGQIFFSLSVGFGVIINYASYLKREDDVVLSGLTSSSMNEFFEVCLGGLITLPAAFIFLGAAAGEQGTFGLGFVALPNVFAEMAGGRLFGMLWFFMLFIAAITSSVSMLQPVIAFLEEGFGLRRHASAALLGLISAMGSGFILVYSKDLVALDMFDFWVGSVMLFLLALAQAVLYGWVFGIERGEEHAHVGANLRIPRVVQYMLKYVVPAYLSVIFACFVWQNALSHDELTTTLKGEWSDQLTAGEVGPRLKTFLAADEIELPEGARLEEFEPGQTQEWEITQANDEGVAMLLYRFVAAEEGLEVWKHKPGYIENILARRSATLSVMFIALIAVFLAIMIHIAGLRWVKEGRLVYNS